MPDLPTGPREPRSTVLSIEEEAVVVAFRRHTLLPLDDWLYALQPTIPHLTRSSLHRCLQRHGMRRSRDRAPANQAAPSLDERAGRAHEPHHQGRHSQALPLHQARPAHAASRRLRRSLQLRPAFEDAEGSHTLRVHLPVLDERTRKVHPQPIPPNAGTEHLTYQQPMSWDVRGRFSEFKGGVDLSD